MDFFFRVVLHGVKQVAARVLFLGIVGCTFANCAALVRAQEQRKPELVKPENIQGCYELTLSAWRPNLNLGEDAVFVTPPHRIQLFAERGTQGWESEGFVVKPAPGLAPSIHRGSYWSPKNSQSIEIVWTTGFSGLAMILKIEGTDLRGEARSFWDFPRRQQKADIAARRVECQTVDTSAAPHQVDCQSAEGQPKIVPGEGWGPVRIGAASKTVDAFLGEGRPPRKYAHVYFKDYETKGIQVSFENDNGTVHNIYFYHGQGDSPEFAVFCGLIDKGISWQSSVEEMKRAYGQPTAEFSGTYLGVVSKRLVFEGIDFRFENEKMVRIGIPGN
jgi:hypothetical protein